eukprot:14429909-Alexandrium_andersonii.AAC.1
MRQESVSETESWTRMGVLVTLLHMTSSGAGTCFWIMTSTSRTGSQYGVPRSARIGNGSA